MNRSGIRRRRTRQPQGEMDDVIGGSDHRNEDNREPFNNDDNHVVSETSHRLSRGTTGRFLLGMFSAKTKTKKHDGGPFIPGDNSASGPAQPELSPKSEHNLPDSRQGLHGSYSMSASSMHGADEDAHRLHEESHGQPLDVTAKVNLDKSRSRPPKDGTSSTKVDSSLWETCSDEEGDDDDDEDDSDDESLFAEGSLEPFEDLFTILQLFKKRDRILKKLLDGKRSEAYQAMMFSNEMAARQKILQRFHRQQQQQQENYSFNTFILRTAPTRKEQTMIESNGSSGGGEQVSEGEDPPKHSAIQSLKRLMLFEWHHSVEGSWFAIWYCFGNAALFSLVELTLSNAWRQMTSNQRHFMAIIVALLMMRADGYLWDWLSAPSREHVNFDMHNRRVLGYWDANLLASFRKGFLSRIKPLNSMVAFYLLFLSVMYFYYQFFYVWAAWFGDFQRCLQRATGCADAVVGRETPDLFKAQGVDIALWKYYICQPVVVPIAPDPSSYPSEPFFPQVVFYSISTMVAAWVMTKSQVGLFAL